jgi:eukaryotic-like serine/threonine-protein kinase
MSRAPSPSVSRGPLDRHYVACVDELATIDDADTRVDRKIAREPDPTIPPDLVARPPTRRDPLEGRRLDRYELGHALGRGTFGSVYAARDTKLGRMLAIKILHREHSENAEVVGRFLQEARATACIAHPGIVTVFDSAVADGYAYIAMELLQGESLFHRWARAKRLPVPMIMEVMRQVAAALDAAHAVGVIHRDLKPENIFLVPDPAAFGGERSKVLDFGLAKATQHASVTTRAATTFGTPPYMSPEQCRSASNIDHRSDIYALGCILVELACGQPPFRGTLREVVTHHQKTIPARLSTLVPNVPPMLDALVAKMLEKDPAQRPATMANVHHALVMAMAA